MSRIMLPYHEIKIREDGRAKRERLWPYQTIIITTTTTTTIIITI